MGRCEPMKQRPIVRVVLPLLTMAIMSSCTHQTAGQAARVPVPKPWTGVVADVSVVWSAEPEIDLFRGPAVITRAYVESYSLAASMGTIEVAYPGFTRAVVAPPVSGDMFADPWPDVASPLPRPVVGTNLLHLLRFDSDGRRVESIVCSYADYTSAFDLGDGNYGYDPGSLDDGVGAMQVTMTAPEALPTSMPPQRGPATSPSVDVFGNWRIDSLRLAVAGPTPEWPTREDDIQACRDRAPDPLERRQFLRRGKHPRSDYPTLPAYPGWPAAPPS